MADLAWYALVLSCWSLRRVDGLSNFRIEVCRGPNCGGNDKFDALSALEALAADSPIQVVSTDCFDWCSQGPNAKCIANGKAALFGASAMNEDERKRKVFSRIDSEERAKSIFQASINLKDRLAAWEPSDPIFPPPPQALGTTAKPTSFFDGYSESELRSILDLHQTIQHDDINMPPPPSQPQDSNNILDLHAAIQAFVQEQEEEEDSSASSSS